MAVLACAMHWEVSAMFAVPVLFVGGWGWWTSRRIKRQRGGSAPTRSEELAPSAELTPHDLIVLGLAEEFELPELEDDVPALAAR